MRLSPQPGPNALDIELTVGRLALSLRYLSDEALRDRSSRFYCFARACAGVVPLNDVISYDNDAMRLETLRRTLQP